MYAGAGGVELLTPRLYNAGTQEATEDLGEVSGGAGSRTNIIAIQGVKNSIKG